MVEVLIDHISLLPPASKVIVAGDFNVYDSQEPAYELLLSTNGTNTLHDPIDAPEWAAPNFSNDAIFTQSTRLTSLDDGAGNLSNSVLKHKDYLHVLAFLQEKFNSSENERRT